jgi:dolichol-phosphate mannosyltransferase
MEGSLPRVMVIIPTYDELANIRSLVPRLLSVAPNLEVLVVDDDSPDGTGAFVEELGRQLPRVHCLRRPQKMGLGSAYRDGFRYALSHQFDLIFEMDADFSHDPAYLPAFLKAIEEHDVVIGSRYVHGVSVVNWPLRRLILSTLANRYVRAVTRLSARDCTSGFRCWRHAALAGLPLDRFVSDGYSFMVEMLYAAARNGYRIHEVPIIFTERRQGESKLSIGVVLESMAMPWRLVLDRRLHPAARGRGARPAAGQDGPGDD